MTMTVIDAVDAQKKSGSPQETLVIRNSRRERPSTEAVDEAKI